MKNRMRRRLQPWRLHRLLLLILLVWCTGDVKSAETEATVKAAYLLNFAKVVEWPAGAFSPGQPLVIGVVGRDPIADELARALNGASANGRKLEVRRVIGGDQEGMLSCHMVFVPASERDENVIGAVQGRPVLLVGEAENFVRRGGALGFVRDAGTLKFEANPKAASRNGLSVSAKLLRVARSVINN